MTVARADNVSMVFRSGLGTTQVLFDVDFEVEESSLTFLVGPSGCGKTTLLSILSGILTPSRGSVSLVGRSLDALSSSEKAQIRRRHLGFVFQQYNLINALTAFENVTIPLVADGRLKRHERHQIQTLFDELGIGGLQDRLPKQLSGGQQQRVAIARAMAHEPRLVICDEPTAALDAASGDATMKLLRDAAADRGSAVVVVTHDSRILHYADRIVEMEDGRILHPSDACLEGHSA